MLEVFPNTELNMNKQHKASNRNTLKKALHYLKYVLPDQPSTKSFLPEFLVISMLSQLKNYHTSTRL